MGRKLGILIFLLCLLGCDSAKKNSLKAKQDVAVETEEAVKETSQEQAPGQVCPSGEKPELISGDCSGVWEVGQTEDGPSCDFKWGPTIECPQGSEGLNYKSVCYGTTSKPTKKVSPTAQYCEEKFGKYPISPKYELWCCSK